MTPHSVSQLRPEILRDPSAANILSAQNQRSALDRLFQLSATRKIIIVVVLAALWEAYGRYADSPLLFPSFTDTIEAFVAGCRDGSIPSYTLTSLRSLVTGYVLGVVFASVLVILAVWSRAGRDLLETLTSMFNPLPAIALFPLALIWFGLGNVSVTFVLIHSVMWAFALNTHTGFRSVSMTLRMVGQNYGLGRLSLIRSILIPAAFPSILTGLKLGWAFAWRTLIAAELVFGISSGSGGLGWYIFENKNELETPNVFAGLLTVIIIGLIVENVIFAFIERRTVRRWGMQS